MKTSKKKKLHNENTKCSSVTNDQNTIEQKSNTENRNTIIKWLKRIFSVKVLTLVVGIITAVVTIWSIWITPKERLKKEINKNVVIIEETFHPDNLFVDSSSMPDVKLIKDFQTSTLKLVTYWKSISTMRPISEYESLELQMTMNSIISQLSTINNLDNESKIIQSQVYQILDYGQKNNIPQYIPAYDKVALVYEKAGKRDAIFNNAKQAATLEFTKLMTEYTNNPQTIDKDMVIKAAKSLENLYNNKEVLEYINTFFNWIIELNSSYMDYINSTIIR